MQLSGERHRAAAYLACAPERSLLFLADAVLGIQHGIDRLSQHAAAWPAFRRFRAKPKPARGSLVVDAAREPACCRWRLPEWRDRAGSRKLAGQRGGCRVGAVGRRRMLFAPPVCRLEPQANRQAAHLAAIDRRGNCARSCPATWRSAIAFRWENRNGSCIGRWRTAAIRTVLGQERDA